MHKRRIALLQPPLSQLNEKAYTQLVRQGLFDISAIAAECLELKCRILKPAPAGPAKFTKLQKEVRSTVEACREFLSRFESEGGSAPPDKVIRARDRTRFETEAPPRRTTSPPSPLT